MSFPSSPERGGFVMGLVVGLLVGLALALGVALYITKAPVPFINKVPQRTAEQDSAEAERNRHWDPNGALGAKPMPRMASPSASAAAEVTASPQAAAASAAAAAAVSATVPAPAKAAARDPAAILAAGSSGAAAPAAAPAVARPGTPAAEPFIYFVQAGAYTRTEEAEQQRARLALMGQSARITEREQVGRTVYRVRIGPVPTREEAAALQAQLQDQSIESQIVRVERP